VLIFFLMLSFAVVIWIGAGNNPIDSSVVARVLNSSPPAYNDTAHENSRTFSF